MRRALLIVTLIAGCGDDTLPDLPVADLSARPDLARPHDLTMGDASAADLAQGADASMPPDQSLLPDEAQPLDESVAQDLSVPPDLTAPRDLALAPDLAGVPASCSDGIWNNDESDTDCGGSCPPCGFGMRCVVGADCRGGNCVTSSANGAFRDRSCGLPLPCADGKRNGDETGVDCGGATCGRCDNGAACLASDDCLSGVCTNGSCVAGLCARGPGQYCAPGSNLPHCDARSGCATCCQGDQCQPIVDYTMNCGAGGRACYGCGGIQPPNPCVGGGHCISTIPGCFDDALQRVFPGTSAAECGPKYKQTSPNDTGFCANCGAMACVNSTCQ